MAAEYRLVLQFPEWFMNFDSLVGLEDRLIEILGDEVDGHDLGSGEANIFIVTAHPEQSFKNVRAALSPEQLKNAKVAYRPINQQKYTILWPPDLREFSVA